MTLSLTKHIARAFSTFALLATMGLSTLSGCEGVALPPIPIALTIVTGSEIIAANEDNGEIDIPLTVFCDLFSEERLDELITAAGGPDLAMLIDIPSIELDSVTVTATAGDFNDFTMATMDMTVVAPNTAPIELGAVSNAAGLGTTFELTQDMPLDLLNDLDDDQCGIPALHLTGQAPTTDIQFNIVANILIYSQVNL